MILRKVFYEQRERINSFYRDNEDVLRDTREANTVARKKVMDRINAWVDAENPDIISIQDDDDYGSDERFYCGSIVYYKVMPIESATSHS